MRRAPERCNVVVEKEVVIKLRIAGDSREAVGDAFMQVQGQLNAIARRRFFNVRRRGGYSERAYVLQGSARIIRP